MWEANIYDKFEKERIQPSIDLVNRIERSSFQRIIDIGCGSGMSTLALRRRFMDANIVGVDLSRNMLNKAKEVLTDVQWIQYDCNESLEFLGTFDLIFSNAFLQWLPNQEKFICNSKKLLVKDGILSIQIPNFEDMKIAKIIKDTVHNYDSHHNLFVDAKIRCFNHSLNEYYNMFSKYYSQVEVWQTNYIHQMQHSDEIIEFVKSTALLPYLEQLNDKQSNEFLDLLRRETAEHYQPSDNGRILFPFERIFIIANM